MPPASSVKLNQFWHIKNPPVNIVNAKQSKQQQQQALKPKLHLIKSFDWVVWNNNKLQLIYKMLENWSV